MVKRWIDPDVASKISFTKSNSDLLQFVPKENLQKRYGGDDEWNYQYIEPRVGENDCLDKAEKRAEVQSERDELADAFERLTLEWIVSQHQSKQSSEKETERQAVAQQLFENYWKLDPYIRARTLYHRAGTLDASTGKADFKASR